MASLAEQLSILSNPAPIILDPEDDVNIETVAKVEKHSGNREVLFSSSELRSKAAAALQDDCDPAYIGKKVSRKSLDAIFLDDSKDAMVSEENTDSDDDDEEDEESDDFGGLEEFKQKLDKQIDSNEDSGEDDESAESESSDDIGSSDEISNKFSNIGVTSETEKRDAVKAQKALWNKLCESRIKLQKLLVLTNKLPQSNNWDIFKKNAGQEMTDCINKGSNSVKRLLNTCLDVQTVFMNEIENESNSNKGGGKGGDDEIPSDTDEEMHEDEPKKEKKDLSKPMKRKLRCNEYSEVLMKRYKALVPYRNSVIQKWDEKTKLSSGNITQKSFSGFESSALKQIEQIVQDEDRLIKRTQLKRSLYRVLGKSDDSQVKTAENPESNESESKQDILLKDYDEEIFDDDDFYRKLLKEVIESKSIGIDPVVLRKQMEIQNVRNKIKKKVDTKASKGRKIRYDVHPKLVGFMRKIEKATISDDARENLLKSFFGRSYKNL